MAPENAAPPDLSKLRIGDGHRSSVRVGARRSPWPWVLVVLLLGGGAIAAWTWKSTLSTPSVATGRVVVVTPTEGNAVLTASGYVVAQRKVILGAKSPRRLVERFVGEGDHVEAGTIVARLDHDDVDARLRSAEASLALSAAVSERAHAAVTRAERDVEEAKAHLDEAIAKRAGDERELKRLRETEKAGASDRRTREQAETSLDSSKAGEAAARSRVTSSEASLEWAKKDLAASDADVRVREAEIGVAKAAIEDTIIRAPFAGVVLLKQAEIGESVSPGVVSGQVTSGSIIQMADFDTLEAEVDVNESNLPRVRDHQPAAIQVDAIPDKVFAGEVRLLMPGANRQKATVAAKVRFLELDPRLKPDLGCKVTFLRERVESQSAPKLLAPASALVRRDGSLVAFVVENGVARMRRVEAGDSVGERVEIRSGLRDGDEVVVSGADALADGAPVRVKP